VSRLCLRASVLIAAVALLTGPQVAAAAPDAATARGTAHAIAETIASEGGPAIGHNTIEGNYLVAWHRGSQVWARVVGADGSPIGAARRISPEGKVASYEPAVAYNSKKNQYLVAWTQQWGPGDHDVWGQRVRADGTLIGAPIIIDQSTDDVIYAPDVSVNTWRGSYLVVWGREDGGGRDVVGQRLRPNGNLLGGTIDIATLPASDQIMPRVAYNTMRNKYLVVWADFRWGASDPDIYGQRLHPTGARQGDEIPIAVSTQAELQPDVGYDPYDNKYLVVWNNWGIGEGDVHGQIVAPSGRLRGPERAIAVGPALDRDPQIGCSWKETGPRWLVVWTDYRWGDDDPDISGRYLNNQGLPLGADYFSVASTGKAEFRPSVTPLSHVATSTWLTAWVLRYDAGGDDYDVWAQAVP
jgi:hypothetical protein